MKKIIVLILGIVCILAVFYDSSNENIQINKLYTKSLEFEDDTSEKIKIDDTKIIERSKEIIEDMYGEKDFSAFEIEYDVSSDGEFYIYFSKGGIDEYYIYYQIEKGMLLLLSHSNKYKDFNLSEVKETEELIKYSNEYIKKIQKNDSSNYEVYRTEYYGNIFSSVYINNYTAEKISILINAETGEFIEYNYY